MSYKKDFNNAFNGGNLFNTSSLFNPYFGPGFNPDDDTFKNDPNSDGGGGGGGLFRCDDPAAVNFGLQEVCRYEKPKCQDPRATNYLKEGVCKYDKQEKVGCLSEGATNRDTTGTVTKHDESLCIYPTPTYSYEEISRKVRVSVTSKGGNIAPQVIVNGGSSQKVTPTYFDYTEKELLTPLVFTGDYSGFNIKGRFRIYTKEKSYDVPVGKTLPNGDFSNIIRYTYYEFYVEAWNGENFIPQTITGVTDVSPEELIQKANNIRIDLNFNATEIENPPPSLEYTVRVIGQLASDDIIAYRTPSGRGGTVKNGQPLQLNFGDISDAAYIEFIGNGISSTSHKVSYQFENSESNIVQTKNSIDSRFQLYPGNNDIIIEATKNPVNPPSGDAPTLQVRPGQLKVNLNSKEESRLGSISYSAENADYVELSIGKNKRRLNSTSGTVSLAKDDFTNGVGTYTAYLQAVSDINGSSDIQKVTINVESKSWLPGPDIRTINYPSVVKGADFKEYDVNFEVSWGSINTNYIHVYAGKVSQQNFIGKFSSSGKTIFNVESVLKKAGTDIVETRDITNFSLLFIPYNLEGDELTAGKTEQVHITFDKGDLKLRRGNVVNDIKAAFENDFNEDGFQELISPFLTHVLHIGDGDNKLVGTLGIDKDTFSQTRINPENNRKEVLKEERSLVLKLYEPLPRELDTNDRVWISKIKSIPVIDKITIIEDTTKSCVRLTPNFDLDFGDDIGYQIYDDLIASGSTSSTQIINQFVSSSNLSLENLDIQFVSASTGLIEFDGGGSIISQSGDTTWWWENFVKYSSAEERVANFFYKVRLIETYENKISSLQSSAGSGSVSIQNEINRTQTTINSVKKEFDAFEKFLYTSSSYTTNDSDSLTYPYNGSTMYSSSNDVVLDWYYSISNSAIDYDFNNSSRLSYNLPQHIKDDSNNSDFILFFDMIGQHFDILYFYTKGLAKSRKLEHKLEDGIKNNLISHMLESLGWDTSSGTKSQVLWEYAFGTSKDGSSVSSMSGEDRQNEVWRRILNNLPYLYKHKGTKRAVHAALSCYGVPASLLTVMEFGGPKDPSSTSATTKFSFEDRTAAIDISGSASILVPWKEYSGDHPNAVEIRVQTSTRQDQKIISGDSWSLDILKDTGSLAKVQLTVGSDSASTDAIPFFNDEYKSIFINRTTGSTDDSFTLYVKEAFQERIRNEASVTLTSASLAWESGSEITIGSGLTFTGSVDEFRLWKDPLSASLLDNHTLLPDAINGNHISSSTEDLLFRNDFEYPKNRSTSGDPYIKNVAMIDSYATFSTASNFVDNSTYPYQYTPYDRTVTAEVPSSGFNVGNKIRFEDQTLVSNLNYKTRATRKMYDQAPIDSNRLGLFFSPIKEINMDILRSLGSFNIDNYIGNPSDEYSSEYRSLRDLRNYYFDRYTLNFQEYIQLVRYIDKSLFDVLESLVPARAKVSKGLLIEPHILERSKTEWKRPSGDENYHEVAIDTQEDIYVSSSNVGIEVVLDANADNELSGIRMDYSTSIDTTDLTFVSGTIDNFVGSISTQDTNSITGSITVNSGSTMGGIEIIIDAEVTASIVSQYDSTQNYESIGTDPESIGVGAFGLYGSGSYAIRTRLVNNEFIKDRVKVNLLTERYVELVPTNSSSLDGSYLQVPRLEEVTKYRKRLNIQPISGSEWWTGSSDVTAEPLDGYFESHYRYVGDLTTGLKNSYFNGSKQTIATTLDGGAPVEIFTTNPNTLRVSPSGRGSGEPILEVE